MFSFGNKWKIFNSSTRNVTTQRSTNRNNADSSYYTTIHDETDGDKFKDNDDEIKLLNINRRNIQENKSLQYS